MVRVHKYYNLEFIYKNAFHVCGAEPSFLSGWRYIVVPRDKTCSTRPFEMVITHVVPATLIKSSSLKLPLRYNEKLIEDVSIARIILKIHKN